MSHEYDFDHLLTDTYTPEISQEPTTLGNHIRAYVNLETRRFHEGRVVDPSLVYHRDINTSFRAIGFDCLLHINEYICPRFVLEFFRQVELVRNEDQSLSLWFWVKNFKYVLTLEQFAQILSIPNHGQCAYTEDWCLESLFHYREENSPYCSYIPSPTELTKIIRTHPHPHPTKIRLEEVRHELLSWAVILRENVLSLTGNREQLPACCAHMIYCLLTQQPYNLAYFFAKRIVHLKGNKNKLIPYGMFLTRLYNHFMTFHPYLHGPQYSLFTPVMKPITESYVSSILISESSTHYAPFDDLNHENEMHAQDESVMKTGESSSHK